MKEYTHIIYLQNLRGYLFFISKVTDFTFKGPNIDNSYISKWGVSLGRIMSDNETGKKDYEEIVVKLAVSNEYLKKLTLLIDIKRIFSSRAEAFRRALELLFEKYKENLESQT